MTWTHTGYAQRIDFGPGAVSKVTDVLRELGGRRVLLVSTQGRLESEAGETLVKRLGRTLAATYADARPMVPTACVQAALGIARDRDIDTLVSFGGGSCIDLGKAVGFFVEHEAGMPGASYADRPELPHITIPTTYVGAAVTASFAMTDEATGRITPAGGPTVPPLAALYDPEATIDTPVELSAASGMTALGHAVEVVCSPVRTPEAEAVALAAATRLALSLPSIVDDPADIDARTAALSGALLAGRALQNSGRGLHHGLTQLLAARTGELHGAIGAAILSSVVAFNSHEVPDQILRLGAAIGDPDDPAEAIDRLREQLGLTAQLSAMGVDDDVIDAVCRMSEGNADVAANPREAGPDEVRQVIEAAY